MLLSKLPSKVISPITKISVRHYKYPTKKDYIPDYAAADKGIKIFKFICFGICLPLTLGFGIYCYQNHEHPKRTPFIKYDHMYIMTKPFPWGDGKRGLFFNPKINATIDGYVDEEEH